MNLDPETENVGVRRVHEPVGFCIYCGAKGTKLTDEHPIPDGFGGRQILPHASCKTCQIIINEEVEQYCLRTFLGLGRAAFEIRSSRKRPPVTPSVRVRHKDGTVERIQIEGEVPALIQLPVWPVPYLLQGLPAPDNWFGKQWAWQEDGIFERYDVEAFISETIINAKVARFLAKMAHAQGIATFGTDYFDPILPPIILGEDKRYISAVGGSLDVRPSAEDAILKMGFKQYRRPSDGNTLLAAHIRLFTFLGGPDYIVVLGETTKPWPDTYS